MISLRDANRDDCDLLFSWVNDEVVRKNSLNTSIVDLDSHIKWFNSKIESNNCKMFIILKDDIEVGQIRIDIDDNIGTINYSIDHRYRKMGIGEFALNEIKNKLPELKLSGTVKKENIASIRAFQKANYKQCDSGDIIKFLWN